MKKIFAFLLVSVLLTAFCKFSVFAVNDSRDNKNYCGDVTWSYDDGVLTFSGEGRIGGSSPNMPWPKQLKSIIIEPGVTSIGPCVFADVTGVEYTEEDPLTGETKTIIPPLESISFPEGLKTIGAYVFVNAKIKNIYIPSSVDKIDVDAFRRIGGLEKIEVSQDNEKYKSVGGCLIQKEDKRLLAATSDFEFPNDGSIEIISKALFSNRDDIETLVLPEGLRIIERYVFSECRNLSQVSFPHSLEVVDVEAFSSCEKITSLLFYEKLQQLTAYSFLRCKGLEHLEVIPDNEYFFSEDNCIISKNDNKLIMGCSESVIPDSVSSISQYAFAYCEGLKSIVIPQNVKEIEMSAFIHCKNLTEITICEGVEKIQNSVFIGCDSLDYLCLPKSLQQCDFETFINSNTREIVVAEGNPTYHSTNNCIIETASKTLVFALNGCTIPDDGTVNKIARLAFSDHWDTIEIPNSIIFIDEDAFWITTGLKEIVIRCDDIGWKTLEHMPNTVTLIKCYKDSTAQKFAMKYGINYEIIYFENDFDGDRQITVADALSALRIAAGLVSEDEEAIGIGDVDKDGHVTVADALAILRVAAKICNPL